ncbi:XRE family transcriptional regulator [uncultured Novosphingobium sp.]|uniref:helix-turn-helix domain-containing protein n=1 Tax=uncultured Novosphingobium sp. TaxID=292277 RepID=UPI0025933A73|nr:XRE family transcriptional regulator [uncultured Novosphingobium sp.]
MHAHVVRKFETSVKPILKLTVFQNFAHGSPMKSHVGDRLKELRLSAVPKLTIRKMAEELGITFPRYVYFEDSKRYKKSELPLDLTRQIAEVLSRYGVDPAEVMKLAGLGDEEAQPEARKIEAARPQVQYFTVQAVMPSEAALAAMFETLLALIPPEATRAEAARILAQRLPTGFAAIGPGVVELSSDEEIEGASLLPTHATGRRGPARP